MPWWILVLVIPVVFLIGGAIGFIVTRQMIKKYMEKNPPINEDIIRTLYQQMGRKPSERQIQTMLKTLSEQAKAPVSQKAQEFSKKFQNKAKKR